MAKKPRKTPFNKEHHERLLECSRKGDVSTWNQWRNAQSIIQVDLKTVDLSSTKLNGVNLDGAFLSKADMSGADLQSASMSQANLEDANLTKAVLVHANLKDAYLRRANLTQSDLTSADLSGADLAGANFTGADLTGANLSKADLTGADLTKANLTGATLTKTKLIDAKMKSANLNKTNLDEAFLKKRDPLSAIESFAEIAGLLKPGDVLRSILEKLKLDKKCLDIATFIVSTVISSKDHDENRVPLWLQFETPPQLDKLSRIFRTMDTFVALISVYNHEKETIPIYANAVERESPWQEKERQELEEKLINKFSDPIESVAITERLFLYRVHEGSINLGLGEIPVWIYKKIRTLWKKIPEWKKADSEAQKKLADAKKTSTEADSIAESVKYVGPKSEAEIAEQWERIYIEQEKRLKFKVEWRFNLMRTIAKQLPEESKQIPPAALMALMYKILTTLENTPDTVDHGHILEEKDIEKLPPINVHTDEDMAED